uniref:Leucine-rich repeat-containing N-terminal plant-type domain-containing protein n=1 Tax=Salix viminalis TaxID=40686 RepID=A0A6N2N312_SALVM
MELNRFSLPVAAAIMMINASLLVQGCLEEERIALLQIKTSIFDPNQNYMGSPLLSWGNDALCCSWRGVYCDNITGRVNLLVLYNVRGWFIDPSTGAWSRDDWYLNATLFLPFQELSSLVLRFNDIAGCVANEGFERLSRLNKLEYLDLGDNNFNNSVLSSLKGLSSLKHLSLRYNQLKGSIDTKDFDSLSKLEELELRFNKIQNFVTSTDFDSLSKLKELDLSENEIQNFVTSTGFERPGSLDKLEILDLSSNRINDSSLSFLKGLSSLKHLNLAYNQIKGSMDIKGFERPGSLDKLEILDLSSNRINDCNLSSLKGLSSLKHLYLRGNQLNGSIDTKDFDSLSELEELDLSENEIQNFVTSTGFERPGSLDKLEILDLSSNRISDGNLSFLKGLSSLKHLHLDKNQLKGSMEMKDFDSLSKLEELYLSGNEIQIFVTSTGFERSGSLDKLEILDLSSNRISDGNLSFLKGLSSLKQLHLNKNQLKGSMEMKEFDSVSKLVELRLEENEIQNFATSTAGSERSPGLNKLEILGLSFNKLNDSSLSFLEGLSSLKQLYLDNNQLKGPMDMKGLCELKQLQELDISHNDLNGRLPSCLANLTNLQVLDISSNEFTGNISLSPIGSLTSIRDLRLSDNRFRIPISLGPLFNLSNLENLIGDNNEIYESTELEHNLIPRFQLQWLSLACNGFGGTFPRFLYYQQDLLDVDLSYIKMTGEFPSWLLQNNTKLEQLYLVSNSLSGSFKLPNRSHVSLSCLDISRNEIDSQIPTEIGSCFPQLVLLNLSRNHFGGGIPSSISNMGALEVLDLSNNGLSGNIPEQLVQGSLSLRVLVLSNNHLKGQLLWRSFNLADLTDLILSGNQLTGILPDSLSNGSRLEALDVSLNNLTGKIPRWIGYMSSLKYLDISENNLSGSLPSNFCSSGMMTQVYLSKNKLEGSLIDAFDGCQSLDRLDLSHNYFRGSIPESIGSSLQLSFLLLGYNNLEGEIPRQLCELEKLSLIDLSNNHLFGHIPPCLKPLNPSGNSLGVEDRQPLISAYFTRPVEISFKNKAVEFTTKSISYPFRGIVLKYFTGIDLSCNNLTGEIPVELGNLSNIKALNLSHNSLTGPIPSTFSNLKDIESLDLSYNNLNGEIPRQLINLYFISVFSVAHNNLSGKTPEMVKQFSTFNSSCYEGNLLLCGPPLAKNCTGGTPPSPVPRPQTHNKEENGFIDMGAYVTFQWRSVLYINPSWRRAWFYFIGESINNCYYFLVDNLPCSRLKLLKIEDFDSKTATGLKIIIKQLSISASRSPPCRLKTSFLLLGLEAGVLP